jgi:hypothetical protein
MAFRPLIDRPTRLWQLNSSAATPYTSVIDKNELNVHYVGSTDEISPMRAGNLDDIHWTRYELVQLQMMLAVVLVFGLFHCMTINSKNKWIRKIKLRQAQDADNDDDDNDDDDDDDDDDNDDDDDDDDDEDDDAAAGGADVQAYQEGFDIL